MDKKMSPYTAGMAIFAMFFGAGNIIFPLALGRLSLDYTPYGLMGLLFTAVLMPFAGLIALFRCNGEISLFFGRLGKIPGLIVATFTISLLGPLGAAPRCIALAHSTLSLSFPGISLIFFSLVACGLIFFFAYKENRLLQWLGSFLSPLKIGLLIWIIIKGFIEAPSVTLLSVDRDAGSTFLEGLSMGYSTMDLLAAFFFAPIILAAIKGSNATPFFDRYLIKASGIGAFLLSAIYIGFCFLSFWNASSLEGIPSDRLLGEMAILILGSHAGLIVSVTVSIACLTTAIALIAAFTKFLQHDLLNEKVDFVPLLILSLLMTFGITTLQFQGIAELLNPILEGAYPALIVLTLYNLVVPIKKERWEKELVPD